MWFTCQYTIPGSSTEDPLWPGQAGTGTQGCLYPDRELPSAAASVSASLAALPGDGTTGDQTGITARSSTTTPLTSPTAEHSSIATITLIVRTGTSATPAAMAQGHFRAEALAWARPYMVRLPSVDLPLLGLRVGAISGRSAALAMEAR